jgi:DNA-binding CsgD family transcriptional regulator
MAERPPPSPPEAHPLTARELQLATLYAYGMSFTAIDRCVDFAAGVVDRHVVNAHRKMSASLKVQPAHTHQRELRAWLAGRGLLPDQGDLEALLDRAILELERNYPVPASLPAERRERLEKHLAEERALLAEATRAMRDIHAQAD